MKIKMLILSLVLALSLVVVGLALANSSVELPHWALSGGASDSVAGSVSLRATLGQPVVGDVSGSDVGLRQGFWHAVCRAPTVAAALNGGVQFTWGGGNAYHIYRAVDDPYANNGTDLGSHSSGWVYNEALLGITTNNAYYVVGSTADCGHRLGEFDFAIVPGS